MHALICQGLAKNFRIKVKAQGLAAGLKALFKPQYREVKAVKGISFQVEPGESVAFLGPNGAGKSTTIKMLTGILYPSAGSLQVLGLDPLKDRKTLLPQIGSVFGQRSQLWFHLPAADSFRLLGAVYEVEDRDLKRRTGELVERFGLGDLMDVPVRKLSLGQRIRCEIAASLLHQPRILFLDEPTIGLDVVVKQEIRTLLKEWNQDRGTTIFLTSHDLGDVEKLCRRALVIHHGSLILDQSLKDLKRRTTAVKTIGVRYAQPLDIQVPGLAPLKQTPDAAKFQVDTARTSLQAVVKTLVDLGEVVDLTVEDEDLETLIAEIYKTTTQEAAHALVKN